MRFPILQVALDFLELSRALKLAHEAVAGGAQWLEAGTPLIKSEGLNSIRALRKDFPRHYIVADLKTMDTGKTEVEAAAKAGANCAIVMGAASESTIIECIQAGKNYGIDICVDMLNVNDPVLLSKRCQEWGAQYIGVHLAIDDQMKGLDPLRDIKRLKKEINIPICVAGGINPELASRATRAGADVIIVGGAIIKSQDAKKATQMILKAMRRKGVSSGHYYKRISKENQIRRVLKMVSTPNISDAMHRASGIYDLIQITPQKKLVGPAFTVRTYPGDWAKPVEAIDIAKSGDVIVIDAGGLPPAVWGELASESCIQKKISGVVIDGAIRDVDAIRLLGFPAFARLITPHAGEPKGFGELNVSVKISEITVSPGDWIVADESGIVVIPKLKVIEIANRAMDVLEKENRIREEIRRKSSLASVQEIKKWEKQIVENIESE